MSAHCSFRSFNPCRSHCGPCRVRTLIPTNKVEVRATLVSLDHQDSRLEQVVGRLSLESGVTAVSWEVVAQELE